MASFTDKALQFNPYIQELPVQEMVQVGMAKQALYDQGVQKIQNQIDRTSGLELYRPQDRQLLESKLNELGSKLKTVAAGDFSNQQLVNSVSGMTGQIVKDQDIRNAVSSTQQYKKALKDREEYLKAGKTSPSNDWLFKQKAEKWFNGDIKETFSGGYDPYTNWRKNAMNVIKELTGDSTITEDAFTTVIGKDGKPQIVLADAITRTKLAGISPEKIKEALTVGLTPADWRQLEIDGAYTYSNITDPNLFKENVVSEYSDKSQYFEKQKEVNGWFFDCYIPSKNLLLEFDGDFWHPLTIEDCKYKFQFKRLHTDNYKNKVAIKNGFNIIRIRLSEKEKIKDII